jgi:hypothetical protein
MRSLLKRWWFWLGPVGLLGIGSFISAAYTAYLKAASIETALHKVKVGMTKNEVDQILDETIFERHYPSLYSTEPRLWRGTNRW